MDVNLVGVDIGLFGVVEFVGNGVFDCVIEIGIVKDDKWCIVVEFYGDFFYVFVGICG